MSTVVNGDLPTANHRLDQRHIVIHRCYGPSKRSALLPQNRFDAIA